MTQPNELKLNLPMQVGNGTLSTTTKVWEILVASHDGDIQKVKQLVNECPDLIYAQITAPMTRITNFILSRKVYK